MKIKTSELTGAALDWAVAKCEGYGPDTYMKNIDIRKDVNGKCSCLLVPIDRAYCIWSPSTDWSQGGPIIEREEITVGPADASPFKACYGPADSTRGTWKNRYVGPTPLIAAMRCYVASKFGDELEVPDELA